MRIIGIDIGNGLAVCCPLDGLPTEPRQFNIDGANYYHFKANVEGVQGLLSLKPDICVLEPTGTNYARLWATHLVRQGIEVRLVGHSQLNAYRQTIGYVDKDDELDAFALAHYCWQYLDEPKRFLQTRIQVIARIRELVLRLAHLNRVQSPIINRMRQDLAWQFPEVSKMRSVRFTGNLNPPLLWRWLCNQAKSKKYDRLYEESIGLGLTDTVKLHTARLVDLQMEEVAIEQELTKLLKDPLFTQYRKVFTQFGFGLRFQAILISQIYPFEGYLDSAGRPIVIIRKGRKSKKPTKRYLSLRRFQKSLGLAPIEVSSGKVQKSLVIGGSDICRQAFWQWIYTRIETINGRKNNPLLCNIHAWMNHPDRKGTPIRLLRMKVAAYTGRLLFKELLKEIW